MNRTSRYCLLGVLAASLFAGATALAQDYLLIVNLLDSYKSLPGVGTGRIRVESRVPPSTNFTTVVTDTFVAEVFSSNTIIRITALPDANNFMYQWSGQIPESLADRPLVHPASFIFRMGEDMEINLLLSRGYHSGEGVGDLDLDGLPDVWELKYALNPEDSTDVTTDTGDKTMPTGWNNNHFDSGSYPANVTNLNLTAPYRPHIGNPWYKGTEPFGLWLECRGFDGWYGPNPLLGGRNDDPGTDPRKLDTSSDGLPDGWQYWFYASAFHDTNVVGVMLDVNAYTNVNGVAPVLPIPNATIVSAFKPTSSLGADLDQDCASDGSATDAATEYQAGTDPLHWDTDADEIADGYEIRMKLNALDSGDADGNNSGDYMAYFVGGGVTSRHGQVYAQLGFDPRTGWGENYYSRGTQRGLLAQPNTVRFSNREKFKASIYLAVRDGGTYGCGRFNDVALDPFKIDTDDDGMFDGWELYVGLNPKNKDDGAAELDDDGLNNFQEFSAYDINLIRGATWPNGRTHFDSAWRNKVWPTDPNLDDTDGDSVVDGAEGGYRDLDLAGDEDVAGGLAVLKYGGAVVADRMLNWNTSCYVGGGLNPSSVDTDGDAMPDHWEAIAAHRSREYDIADENLRNGMDGTVKDPARDYDSDGLVNYQEYLSGAVHHWRYTEWVAGQPLGGYDPFTFFTGTPHEWDWHILVNNVPYFFIEQVNSRYTCVNPRLIDTDLDDMDDYYEIYHGLNPMFGVLDVHNSMVLGATVLASVPPTFDIRVAPYAAGSPFADPDQDGLPNWEESLQANAPSPKYYHTDPSPSWITDPSYQRSFVNLYYDLGTLATLAPGWYYGPKGWTPPSYLFSFENSEGFDTDGDMLGDRAELVDSQASPGSTDPLSSEAPPRRRALYLNGDAAARTRGSFLHGLNDLTEFTVEAWIKSVNPASGSLQVIIERPVWIPKGNTMPSPDGSPTSPEGLRRNFRLAIDADGKPLVSYTGAGFDGLEYQDVIAKSIHPLASNQWQHLSGVYNGTQKKLYLYVNGEMRASIPAAERPVNGWSTPDPIYLDVNPGFTFDAPLVVGAADRNPEGRVNGQPVWVGSMAGTNFTAPDLHSFFNGWVDEVRIWNGAKTMAEVQRDMDRKMSMTDVATYQRSLLATNATPELKYLYSFDNLLDPTREGSIPQGFDLLNGRPNDGSYPHVPWWGTAPDRSLVYNNYLYVPWIVNQAARLPLDPPADSPYNSNTYVVSGVTLTRNFPNTANPYNLGYYHASFYRMERHPDVYPVDRAFDPANQSPLFNDLLPLRFARVDAGVELWDGSGGGVDPYDSNGDGIPDWWEQKYGFDPKGPSVAMEDPNGDGINNYWCFKLGADPFNGFSLDPAGLTSDANWDSDGDSLSNYDELNVYLTDPTRADTDDDEAEDGIEVLDDTDPAYSASPVVFRALRFGDAGGTGRVVVSDKIGTENTQRSSLTNWTIETLVRPALYPASRVALVSRRVAATGKINYELGLTAQGMPYIRFDSGAGSLTLDLVGVTQLPISEWTHVAARYDSGTVTLFVNGVPNASKPVTLVPAQGVGDLIFGGNGYVGDLKEIRIWAIPRTDEQIAAFKSRNLFLGFGASDPGFLQVSGNTGHLRQNCVTADPLTGETIDSLTEDWTLEAWVKTTDSDGGVIVARWNTSTGVGGEDFNYYLGMRSDGTLIGRWVLAYTKEDERDDGTIDESEVILNPTVNNIVGAIPINDGRWHHVAYVRDVSKTALYVDGVLDATQAPTLVPLGEKIVRWGVRSLAGPLTVGYQLTAEMDEVRIWNRGLTRIDLNRYNKRSLYGNEEGLITYFNFDFQQGDLAEERADVKDAAEEPGIYISPAQHVRTGDTPPILTDPIQTYRLALAGYYPADDGGLTLEDFQQPLDWAYAGELISDVRFVTYMDPAEYPYQDDSNHDGIPNWWDILHGMDPDGNSAPGDGQINYTYNPADFTYGAWGDPDQDGLNNWAEQRAGTDPHDYDSAVPGRSDYHSPTSGASYGSLYMDGDDMPDAWESLFPLACSPKLFDPKRDADQDGWDNLSEYLGTGLDYIYSTNRVQVTNENGGVEVDIQYRVVGANIVSPTRPYDGNSFPLPKIRFSFFGQALNYVNAAEYDITEEGYLEPDDVALIVWAFSDPQMREPDAQVMIPIQNVFDNGATADIEGWSIGHLHKGPNIFMAFIDMNTDGKWNPGEWLGFSENGTEDIQIGSADIKIPLTDKPAGYIRFSWEQQMEAIETALAQVHGTTYLVEIISLTEARSVFMKTNRLETMHRPFITEMDLMQAGLPPMYRSYKWLVGTENGTVYASGTNYIDYPTTLTTPVVQSPAGSMIFAQERIRMQLDPRATQVQIQIQNVSSGQTVLNVTKTAPYVDIRGMAEMDLPMLAGFGALTNGQYRILVRAFNPRTTASSAWVNFSVDLKSPQQGGAAMIQGHVTFYGWHAQPRIVVEAYTGRGTLAKTLADTNLNYTLMGLPNGDYNVRAFHDFNNNGVLDNGESWGLVKGSRDDSSLPAPTIYAVDYLERVIKVRNAAAYGGNDLAIYHADTDNDTLPDMWEYFYAGNLSKMNGTSDWNNDGWSDYENFRLGRDPRQTYSIPLALPILSVGPLVSSGRSVSMSYVVQGAMPKVVVVQSTTNIVSPSWREEFRSTVTRSGIYTNTVPSASGSGNKFFRIRFLE